MNKRRLKKTNRLTTISKIDTPSESFFRLWGIYLKIFFITIIVGIPLFYFYAGFKTGKMSGELFFGILSFLLSLLALYESALFNSLRKRLESPRDKKRKK